MNNRFTYFLIAFLAICLQPTTWAEESAGLGPKITFPAVSLAIPQPNGFDKAEAFHGFQQALTSSSVMLSAILGPFSEVSQGFNQEGLATQGMTLRSKENIEINNQSGLLLNIAQSAYGQEFLKWIVVFGNESRTNIITATFPEVHSKELSEPLKKVVLAVSTTEQSNEGDVTLPFTIEAEEGLARVKGMTSMGKMALFTKDGTIPIASPNDPLLIVAPSLGYVPVGEYESFAISRLYEIANTNIESVTSIEEIVIDGLQGLEIMAVGKNQKTQTQLIVYQVMLFPKEGGYMLMVGLVGDEQAKEYMPKFKTVVRTYQSLPQNF